MQGEDGLEGVEHVAEWKTKKPINLKELFDKYRPKEIARYDENGKVVRVFEKRWC